MAHLPRLLHLEEEDSLPVEEVVPDLDERRRLLDDPVPEAAVHLEALEAEAGPVVELDGELSQPLRTL